MNLNDNSREPIERDKGIAITLYEIDGVKFGEFTLSSGKKSPYYVDMRVVPSHPNLFDKVTSMCSEMLEEEIDKDYFKVAGVPTAGLPFSALVSQKLFLPMIYVRKKEKSHGRKKGIEGKFSGGEVVLIDDVSTTGGSIIEAAETVRDAGGTVNHAAVILDREEGATENLREEGIELHACYSISEMVELLKDSPKLDEKEYETIMNYLKN